MNNQGMIIGTSHNRCLILRYIKLTFLFLKSENKTKIQAQKSEKVMQYIDHTGFCRPIFSIFSILVNNNNTLTLIKKIKIKHHRKKHKCSHLAKSALKKAARK